MYSVLNILLGCFPFSSLLASVAMALFFRKELIFTAWATIPVIIATLWWLYEAHEQVVAGDNSPGLGFMLFAIIEVGFVLLGVAFFIDLIRPSNPKNK